MKLYYLYSHRQKYVTSRVADSRVPQHDIELEEGEDDCKLEPKLAVSKNRLLNRPSSSTSLQSATNLQV